MLTPKQHKALAALLAEPTVAAAAAKVRVGERTLHTWLQEPAFSDAYRTARRHAVGQAIARLQQTSTEAVNVLHYLMCNPGTRAATRVAAARTILDTAIRAVELEDLAQRLATLEQLMSPAP